MKSKKREARRPKVLVDTSFLLPALGVEVEEEVIDSIPLFRRVEVLYLEIAVVEAMWKVLRVVPPGGMERVALGLEAIKRTYRAVNPPPEAYVEASEIYYRGHRDYIDALNYSTAKLLGIPFLTIDLEFAQFLEENGYEVEGIIVTPSKFKEMVGERSRQSGTDT